MNEFHVTQMDKRDNYFYDIPLNLGADGRDGLTSTGSAGQLGTEMVKCTSRRHPVSFPVLFHVHSKQHSLLPPRGSMSSL